MKTLIAATALAMTLPFAADAKQKARVVSASGDQFEVGFNANHSPNDYWCAAGNYVVGNLRMPGTTRIYVTSPLPRPRGQGVTFSLSGPSSGHRDGLAGVVVSRIDVLRAHHARALCQGNSYDFD